MKTFRTQLNIRKKDQGFVVLFAVLISSVVLAITLGISNVAYKEVLLTSEAREANYAFFAADSGAECALYGDLQKTGFGLPDGTAATDTFECNGITPALTTSGTTNTKFKLEFTNAETNALSCALIEVEKDLPVLLDDGTTASFTEIRSLGYNVDCTKAENLVATPSLRVVERAIRVTYPNDEVTP